MLKSMPRMLPLASVALLSLTAVPAKALPLNLVVNGDFDSNTGIGQITPATSTVGNPAVPVTLTGWTKTCVKDCGSQGFAFVIDANADSTGFASVNSRVVGTPGNIKIWGPANGISNGFTGSPQGGQWVGIDGDYGRSKITQTISGLTPGDTYNLAFSWAGSQFTDETGATTQYWSVDFGSSNQTTTIETVPSQGFSGWLNATMDFVAGSATQDLSFTAFGSALSGSGSLPPFLMLDGVTLINTTSPPPDPKVAAPGPLPLLGAAAALRWSRTLRRRLSGNQA